MFLHPFRYRIGKLSVNQFKMGMWEINSGRDGAGRREFASFFCIVIVDVAFKQIVSNNNNKSNAELQSNQLPEYAFSMTSFSRGVFSSLIL